MFAGLSLKNRLILAFGLPMVVAVIIPLVAVGHWGGKMLEANIDRQLADAVDIVTGRFQGQADNNIKKYVSMRPDYRLRGALESGDPAAMRLSALEAAMENQLRIFAFLSPQGQVLAIEGQMDEPLLAKIASQLSSQEVQAGIFVGDAYVAQYWLIPFRAYGEAIGYAVAVEEFTQDTLELYALSESAGFQFAHVELWDDKGLIMDDRQAAQDLEDPRVATVMLGDGLYLKILIDAQQTSGVALDTFRILLIISSICIFCGLVVARMVAARSARPISGLVGVSRQVGKGDYKARAVVTGAPELVELGLSFNEMIGELDLYQTQMEGYARKLEQRVEQRTQKLQQEVAERQAAEQRATQSVLELEKAHELLKQNQGQLVQQAKMASLGQISAGVAHEINNPVGFIMSNMGTLKEYMTLFNTLFTQYQQLEDALESRQQQEVDRLTTQIRQLREKEDLQFILDDMNNLVAETQDGANRVRDIVKDLKTFARVDEADIKTADLNEGIESTLRVIWNELKYNCTVEKHYGDLPTIRCYPGQLNQVFMNILVNASHAIGEKGTVTIETLADDKAITLRFSDTGAGIAKENLEKLFDPFFTTKAVGKGTGLGLSIAFGIIKNHGGSIDVQSELGKGTTFTITLPLDGIPGD